MRTPRALAVALLALLALLASGCGGDGSEGTASSDAGPGTTTVDTASSDTSVPDEAFSAEVLAPGDQHVCALDGNGEAWCWGYNRFGQLGDGTNDDSAVPVAVATDARFTALSSGRYFTCGITDDGSTLCWGDNSRGSLGNGETGAGSSDADRNEPVAVTTDQSFTSIVSGQQHSCALTADGAAWCWGAYAAGQLGNGAGDDATTPQRSAEGLELASLAPMTGTSTCGLTSDGQAWCWGNNTFGQLGRGDTTNARQPDPAPVAGGTTFTELALGRTHACGIASDGTLLCWGANDGGQLGDGTTDDHLVPTPVDTDLRFVGVTADDAFTCAVSEDGDGYCWGRNVGGRLGDGSRDDATTPIAVSGGLRFSQVAAGEEFTCGVTTDGGAWCWGANRVGWLGDGTEEASLVPVPVAG